MRIPSRLAPLLPGLVLLSLSASLAGAQPTARPDATPSSPTSPPVLDNEPATSAIPPRRLIPDERLVWPGDAAAGRAAPAPPSREGAGEPARPSESSGRTAPPPGHRTLPPPEPPATNLPERSSGIFDLGASPIPDRPTARPDASTTHAPRP